MNKLGNIQGLLWTVGMALMAVGMHAVGLIGAPRRTSYTTYGDHIAATSWDPYLLLLAKGNTECPISEGGESASITPKWTERWGLWIILMIVVVSLGYVIPLINMIQNAPPGSPPFVTW